MAEALNGAFVGARFTAPDGVELAADIGGPLGAPTVILMHGGGQTRHSWSGAMRALVGAGYRVINFDARGHGDSSWSAEGRYSLSHRHEDLQAILSTVEGPFALVGASLGGAVAMHAVSIGLRPAALVLVDITPQPDMRGVARIRAFMRGHPQGFASLDEAAAAVAAYNPDRPRPNSPEGLRRNLRLADDGRLHWHWDPRILGPDAAPEVSAMEQTLQGLIAADDLPVLLVRGGHSDIVTNDSVRCFKYHLPWLEVCDVAGAGHMVAGDRNDAFNSAILGHLARHLSPPPG